MESFWAEYDRVLVARRRVSRAQAHSLRLAAPFGNGFGEIGEQHREPEPQTYNGMTKSEVAQIYEETSGRCR
jgi:hypothetical protein